MAFDRNYLVPSSGLEFHFVIDESGEDKNEEGEREPGGAKEKSESLLGTLADALTGNARPARARRRVDSAYDRLHFDFNRDLDLTNDPVVRLMDDPPQGTLRPGEKDSGARVFDYLDIPFDYGDEVGARPFRVLAKLQSFARGSGYVAFVATVARKGRIRLGDHQFNAILSQSYSISGRFDRPYNSLRLTPVDDSSEPVLAWGPGVLCAMQELDGVLYRITSTPSGDKLTVAPYQGDFGTVTIDAGGRQVDKLGLGGMLMSDQWAMVMMGSASDPFDLEKLRQVRVPVGDYLPVRLAVDLGELTFSLSPNRFSGAASGDEPRPPSFDLEVRKDKPLAIEFSEKPKVQFTNPTEGQTFKPGETVKVEAVLVEPALGMMISGLQDTTRKERDITVTYQGKQVTIPRYATLDPTVVITDSSGKQVAEGKMPFG